MAKKKPKKKGGAPEAPPSAEVWMKRQSSWLAQGPRAAGTGGWSKRAGADPATLLPPSSFQQAQDEMLALAAIYGDDFEPAPDGRGFTLRVLPHVGGPARDDTPGAALEIR